MPGPTERKTVQNPIIKYATEISLAGDSDIKWIYVNRNKAEEMRGFYPNPNPSTIGEGEISARERAKAGTLFFNDLLYKKVKEFNADYEYSKAELINVIGGLTLNIQGNREFLKYLRGEKTYFVKKENRELNLKLIDYSNPENNIYHVTDEYYYFKGRNGNREDIVFLINGIPVVVIECKNVTKEEAIAVSIDQIRRYHNETPEMMIPEQIYTATEALGFAYGVTWNMNRRNIFNWKDKDIGNLEAKVKTFFSIEHILDYLKNLIIFQEKDEVLSKFIFQQHQAEAVNLCVERALDKKKSRGLVWHTQGSGKTFTIIKTAEILYKATEAEKPTILLMIDRNELQDQLMRNLDALGLKSAIQAYSIDKLEDLLNKDFRGIIVCMIHKFRGIKPDMNLRKNIYVLIDEAHRTTGGDLGTFLMAAVPNASLIGFTGTPIDKTAYGKGTFKIFGGEDEKGYLHKYSIAESIADGTTLPLYYSLAPNELLVPSETLEEEFFKLAETEGISDIEELNKILQRAVRTKTFLKGTKRVNKIAKFVAEHYMQNVEPLGYKAFLVGVDREACALYKKAIDKYLPTEYSVVVYSEGENDSEKLKKHYLSEVQEKQVRKDFANLEKLPKILIVTEKLLTGYDAPCLYAMYLDKPMRDHTLLQAIARVNRPYVNEEKDMKKPHGFVLDFVGIFDKLEKALSFDSDIVNAVVKDINLLKQLFQKKMDKEGEEFIKLVNAPFTDKEVDKLIEYFKDKSRRAEFVKFYKEIEMLYEIISPDAFLSPYIEKYGLLSNIYKVVHNAYMPRQYVDREFMRKTENLVKEKTDIYGLKETTEIFEINEKTLQKIKEDSSNDNTKVINLVKSVDKASEDDEKDLILLSMKEKADEIKERYEDSQMTTRQTLKELEALMEQTLNEKKEKSEKHFDDITYFVFKSLREDGFEDSEKIANEIKGEFTKYPYWKESEKDLRELRLSMYASLLGRGKDVDVISKLIDKLFSYLIKN